MKPKQALSAAFACTQPAKQWVCYNLGGHAEYWPPICQKHTTFLQLYFLRKHKWNRKWKELCCCFQPASRSCFELTGTTWRHSNQGPGGFHRGSSAKWANVVVHLCTEGLGCDQHTQHAVNAQKFVTKQCVWLEAIMIHRFNYYVVALFIAPMRNWIWFRLAHNIPVAKLYLSAAVDDKRESGSRFAFTDFHSNRKGTSAWRRSALHHTTSGPRTAHACDVSTSAWLA